MKKYRNNLDLTRKTEGTARRKTYAKEILHKKPTVPIPLTYNEIDKSFVKFVEDDLSIVVNGKEVPTFTLFSNQRFSEYSQTWQHNDEEGNLILNFKTISRNMDTDFGGNQGKLYNIPGNRWYEIGRRVVLDDNGTEHFEVISMKQPYAVDFLYKVGFITDKFEEIGKFNTIVNDLFKSRQWYIRPNGHHLPMVLESISDESEKSIEDRKFYSQTITIKVMAYIVNEEDYRVDMLPMRYNVVLQESTTKRKPKVSIEEFEVKEKYTNLKMNILINLDAYDSKVEFDIDSDMVVTEIVLDNLRQIRMHINGSPFNHEQKFTLKNGDNLKFKAILLNETEPSSIKLIGYVPNEFVKDDYTPENIYDEEVKVINKIV